MKLFDLGVLGVHPSRIWAILQTTDLSDNRRIVSIFNGDQQSSSISLCADQAFLWYDQMHTTCNFATYQHSKLYCLNIEGKWVI
jgi:hypothetical protein